MSEEILGIFTGWIRDKSSKLITKGWTCKLVFTTSRLIVADMKRRTGQPQFVGGPDYIYSQASARNRLKMEKVSAESMLKAHAENFEIPYSDIAAVEMKSFIGVGHRDLIMFTMGNLDVPKYRFSLYIRERHKGELNEFLGTILPGKV